MRLPPLNGSEKVKLEVKEVKEEEEVVKEEEGISQEDLHLQDS